MTEERRAQPARPYRWASHVMRFNLMTTTSHVKRKGTACLLDHIRHSSGRAHVGRWLREKHQLEGVWWFGEPQGGAGRMSFLWSLPREKREQAFLFIGLALRAYKVRHIVSKQALHKMRDEIGDTAYHFLVRRAVLLAPQLTDRASQDDDTSWCVREDLQALGRGFFQRHVPIHRSVSRRLSFSLPSTIAPMANEQKTSPYDDMGVINEPLSFMRRVFQQAGTPWHWLYV
ncbi:MAG: hypothetical protein GDA54_03210 [Alphaproteobacteria bacterium GM7ARS4]|nr:hypothetical protein [Alphaproteobacteria bacterium GM7ARS4]